MTWLPDQAIADFTKTIELKPDDAIAYNFRRGEYGHKGLHGQAIADYTKAIEFNSDYAKAYNNRAWEYH